MLENKEFKIEGYDFTFRIKTMNAIEAFAIQSQFDFRDLKRATNLINVVLEHIEIKVKDQWLPVKMEGRNVFVPESIESDVHLLRELMNFFSDKYLDGLFQKSDESK